MATFRASDDHLNKPGALIAALPAVLGFVPEHSLTIVTVEDGQLSCVMRVDLSEELVDSLDHLAEVAAAAEPDGALAVIVDDDGMSCRACLEEHRCLVAALTTMLAARDVELLGAFVADRVEAGGQWLSLDGRPGWGRIEDPRSSPMAAAAVLGGRALHARRTDLEDVIATADPARTEALRAAMVLAEHDGDRRPRAAARRDVEHAVASARRLARGVPPADADLVRLAWGVTDTRVRDVLYALAVGPEAGAAEALWALLARTLPDPWRVEAIVQLAFSAYARGDGPLAGVSLEAALRSDEEHRMARMLDQALQTGMRPEQIRELAQTGHRLAKRMGVRLPPHPGGPRTRVG
ncbi:hypothetical protein MMAD_23460 [Mycolicibacterium madagascariense]|uniref:DUF4192 domain-containing protein n=1 Tax=Mycolicibacterium madagascariense TaxID=212765 RepID=A0A7I7XFV7_9MYCO|nr:DUF4192 domain-containing protein [Mycolicibacterium madagascariense]MCV7013910.1 DUF4192 domain-containing protein [Mycolicibacterium madagascariense]BBZ28051.1 hypothetical protein MMAD_23460 [Mycolicibacterium madagascariense]